jgi:titin
VNLVGVGIAAQSTAAVPFTKAGAVTKVVAVPRAASAALTWRAPSNGGLPIIGYQIDIRRLPATAWTVYVRTTGTSATSRTIPALLAGKGYQFRVKAVTRAGVATASAASAVVRPLAVPAAPSHVQGVVRGRTVVLTWTAPVKGGPRVTGYQIAYSVTGGRTWVLVATTRRAKTSATLGSTGAGGVHVYRVRTLTPIGAGGWSARSNRIEQ